MQSIDQLKHRLAECFHPDGVFKHDLMPIPGLLHDCRTALESQEQEIKGYVKTLADNVERIAELEALLAQMREVLLKWKAYHSSDWPQNQEQQEQAGEQFTEAWFDSERALSTEAGKAMLERLQKAEGELLAIKQEEVRRIRHLNRLGTWAQQDPTGPIVRDQIQAWVLTELKAALGSAYEPTSWQPETAIAEQENKELQDRLQAVEKERDRAIELLRSTDDDAISEFLKALQPAKEQ